MEDKKKKQRGKFWMAQLILMIKKKSQNLNVKIILVLNFIKYYKHIIFVVN